MQRKKRTYRTKIGGILLVYGFFILPCYGQDTIMNQVTEHTSEDSVVVIPGELYKAGKIKRFFFGNHYRDAWTTAVKIPTISLEEKKGGLSILGEGGGMQTYSLKLKGKDGKLYSFRSIQKDPTPILPVYVRPTFFADIVQDQISAAHPYGAFIIPPLARAAKIYYTNPKLYYLMDLENLGQYREKFGGMVVMLEEDADEDWSNKKSFGYTENAVGTNTVLEDLRDENETNIDENFLLRARLFDMWIGDWDRHAGQWRWAEQEDENGETMFRPIPEDRDNAFFKFDGFFPWFLRRKWAFRKFQKFDNNIRDIAGLNFNARHFDRIFLSALNREDWLREAESLQSNLTDSVIDSALSQWPQEIYELNGEEIASKLKSRREKLVKFTSDYYSILAKTVSIYGSDESEYFEVVRKNDVETIVSVYDIKDHEKDEKIYERTFIYDETREIVLYGFEDDDQFHVSGNVKKGILIRIVGGAGEDGFVDNSHVNGLKKMTQIYDNKSLLTLSDESKDMTSNDVGVNNYDPKGFKYDSSIPQISLGFNPDDGVFIGGGVLLIKHGFRKTPYKSKQRILANVSTQSTALNFTYSGEFIELLNSADFVLETKIRAPNYNSNFHGLGNETTGQFSDEFYNYRIVEIKVAPALQYRMGKTKIQLGPVYEYYNVLDHGGILTSPEISIESIDLDEQHYVGFEFKSNIGDLHLSNYPLKGVSWNLDLGLYEELDREERAFAKIESNLYFYYTIGRTKTTVAMRIGGAHIVGDAPFFKVSTLSGNQGLGQLGNLRGMRRNRFSGQSVLYHNFEIRQSIAHFKTYLATFEVGLSILMDQGRVWQQGENSNKWHRGVGGGPWVNLYEKLIISATYTKSDVDSAVDVQLGFLF
jgi:hypothetical protein